MKHQILTTGYTKHPEVSVMKGGSFRNRKFPASVVYIEHPRHGKILFDTGYSPRFFEATRRFPEKFYALVTPVFNSIEDTAAYQLKQRGIAPEDIDYVIISHFHADHTAGLADFPKARYIFLNEGYRAVQTYSRFKGVTKAFLKDLLPEDFERRAAPFSLPGRLDLLPGMHGLQQYDIFGDGSLIGVGLPGHAVGQMGLWLPYTQDPMFFVADSCWLGRQVIENIGVSAIAYLIMDSKVAYKETLHRLHQIHRSHPGLKIVPCHCEQTLAQLGIGGEV